MIKKLFITFLFACTFFQFPAQIQAQSYDSYIWEFNVPQTPTNADDLIALLKSHVQKIMTSGHLLPYRTIYGEVVAHFSYYNPHDIIYTLSLAYPYMDIATQTNLRSYLKTELTTYPIWSSSFLNGTNGTSRQYDDLPAGQYQTDLQNALSQYNNRPRLFALYALWLYAHNTGDWAYIESNWSAIKSFYNAHPAEINRYYTSMAGAIGAARMAAQKPTPDTAFLNTVLSQLNTGFTTGKNYIDIAQYTENAYIWLTDYTYPNSNTVAVTRNTIPLGFHLIDITPEIGRYLNADTGIRTQILGTSEFGLPMLIKKSPMWYMAQAPQWNKFSGEGSGSVPFDRAMIFPIKNWIQNETAAQLRRYIDVPDAAVGDCYYLQNLVRVIEASGPDCWKDVRNPNASCMVLGASTEVNWFTKVLHFIGIKTDE